MRAASASSLCPAPMPCCAMLLLLLIVLPLSLGEEQKMQAMQEDLNVLVYGTLQLGQALRDTYSSTNDKLQRIAGRQGNMEKRIERLQAEVSRARQEARRIGEEVDRLQREEHERRSLSRSAAEDLRDTQREYAVLQRWVQDLEKGVRAKEQLLPDLMERIEQQNLILQVITEETARQKKQMAEQRERLLTVLRQASAIGSS
ncbi:angiopoietin-like protein 8 [Phyllobates terribilis]|uniref:angiopoietin-like protein 8 n=1 Tax=Phyllobates terribilis TaxID=111132 RepID=UPI003CCB6F76